jgi:hypothetical protein
MSFLTIGQYFNKLQSALLLLLMAPLLLFIALHVYISATPSDLRREYFVFTCLPVVLDWLVATILFNKKIKSVRNVQGLGAKLDKYFCLTIVRFSFFSAGSMLIAVGFYLSASDVFTGIYLVGLALSLFFWPTSQRVSRHLRLRGDEREMVYFKKDRFD